MLCGRILQRGLYGALRIAQFSNGLQPLPRKIVPAILTKDFHTTDSARAKLFQDTENKYAHEVLEQSLKPYQIFRVESDEGVTLVESIDAELPAFVLDPPASVSESSADEIFRNFCLLTRYCRQTNICFSDERFRRFTQLFCDVTQKLSDDQLLETLRQITQLPVVESVKAPNFVELWNTLDVECCQRLETWPRGKILLVCDAWYALHLARICEFVWEALRKLGRQVRKMRPEELVQAMFFCNVMRRPLLGMFDFEVNLALCASDMTLKELGVMSMGFFKTRTPIRNPELLEHLYRRLMAELDTVEDITLVSILKVLRYSSKLPQAEIMMELMNGLCGQIERISLLSCLHVALLGSDLQCCHDETVERILQRFNREIGQTRLKDLERICLIIGVFNFRSVSGVEKDLAVKILSLLRTKTEEIMRHPRCFPTCLHFLTIKGNYDAEMLSTALDTRFIHHAYGKNVMMARELFHLDSFVKINLKDSNYQGHQLPDKHRRSMGKMLTHYIPERNPKYKLNATDRILLEIKEATTLRPSAIKHILPHFERPDIVLCYDKKQQRALPLNEECPADYSGVILTRQQLLGDLETSDIDTVAIVVAGWNNVVRGKDINTGLFDMKLNQLRLLGHKYIVIYWHEWRELETSTDRQNFLRRRLATVINL